MLYNTHGVLVAGGRAPARFRPLLIHSLLATHAQRSAARTCLHGRGNAAPEQPSAAHALSEEIRAVPDHTQVGRTRLTP